MPDMFKSHTPSLNSPASHVFPIEPNDTAALSHVTRAVYVGGQGNLQITALGGQTITLTNVPAGTIFPLRCTHVLAGETTATALVGLF